MNSGPHETAIEAKSAVATPCSKFGYRSCVPSAPACLSKEEGNLIALLMGTNNTLSALVTKS